MMEILPPQAIPPKYDGLYNKALVRKLVVRTHAQTSFKPVFLVGVALIRMR